MDVKPAPTDEIERTTPKEQDEQLKKELIEDWTPEEERKVVYVR